MAHRCICNLCGAEFDIAPRQRTEDDLDIVYLKCPHCDEEYLVSVTDSVLRDAIAECKNIMQTARTTTDAETSDALAKKAREMRDNNLLRCHELAAKYKK